jgi:ribosomal protein S6
MAKETKSETSSEINLDTSIYEVGYHLIPTLAEDTLGSHADAVKAIITNTGGEIISEGLPELKVLAYAVDKHTKAYFGWIKFSISPSEIGKIKITLDASKVIPRHLIIGTVKESTLMADKEKRPAKPEAVTEKEAETAL